MECEVGVAKSVLLGFYVSLVLYVQPVQWDWSGAVELIIIICNSYIAPNPTRLAQSTSQFKTRMDFRINT